MESVSQTPQSPLKGLSSADAAARLAQFGPNEIEAKEVSWLQRLLRRFWGPIPWMIEVAAVLSFSVRRWEEFTVIVVMLLVNAFVDPPEGEEVLADALNTLSPQEKVPTETDRHLRV